MAPWSEADTERAREHVLPLEPPSLVHLNSAGCSLASRTTLGAVQAYLTREATQGGYEAEDASSAALQRPYTALAALLNCSAEEVAVVTSATAAWQQVVYGLAWTWRTGDRVLTSVAEYGSNYIALLQLARRTGVGIEVMPETDDGDIDTAALEASLSDASRPRPVLVCISHVPTSSGRVYDAEAVGAACRRAHVPYMLDACQSVGQMPIDVQRIGCDFLAATGRKYLRAPRGTGFLYCRREAMASFEPAMLDNIGATWSGRDEYTLQPGARRFETYETCFAAKVGLGVAVDECLALGVDRIWEAVQGRAQALRRGLRALPRVVVRDHGRRLCGLVSFTVEGWTAGQVKAALAARHINVSVSGIGSTRIDYERRGLREVVRASVHYYTTAQELQRLVDALDGLPAAPPA